MAADRRKLLTWAGLGLIAAGVFAALQQSGGSSSSSSSGSSSGTPAGWPAGWPPPGSLVNPVGKYVGDLSQAWVIGSDKRKHGIPSQSVFQACHFPGGVVTPIDPALLAQIPQGADVSFPSCWPPVCGSAAMQQRQAWGLPAPSASDCPNG